MKALFLAPRSWTSAMSRGPATASPSFSARCARCLTLSPTDSESLHPSHGKHGETSWTLHPLDEAPLNFHGKPVVNPCKSSFYPKKNHHVSTGNAHLFHVTIQLLHLHMVPSLEPQLRRVVGNDIFPTASLWLSDSQNMEKSPVDDYCLDDSIIKYIYIHIYIYHWYM
jgi:hypothetical protein